MPRKQQGWITFQSSQEEREILEQYCQETQRTKTEILRELVRGLKSPPESNQTTESITATANTAQEPIFASPTVRFSARNILKGTIRRLIVGAVNAEVALEIVPGLELIAVITSRSAQHLGLAVGKEVYAVIKSSNIMIAAVASSDLLFSEQDED